jgi:hypothetical protein
VIAALGRTHRAPVAQGWSPPQHRSRINVSALAFANGWNLATTLMACVVIFHADAGNYGVMLAAEYDGDPGAVIHEFDPFQP